MNTPAQHLNFLKTILEGMLANLDNSLIRDAKYLQIIHPNILGVKYLSHLYLQSNMANIINLQLSKDSVVVIKEATSL